MKKWHLKRGLIMKRLYGTTCATITPMQADGTLDIESARSLYRYLVDSGVHCFYPNGTNGESYSLTKEEREQLAETCISEVSGNRAVYIQCGAPTVGESYSHIIHAKKAGADGVGVMTPAFLPVDEAGLEEYYCKALEMAGDFPVYVYNIPSRTGNDVSPELFDRLAHRYGNLCGIKYSAPDLLRLSQYIHAREGKDIDVLIGCDKLAVSCLMLGGKGYVSGPCAAFPNLYLELYEAFEKKDMPKCMCAQEKIREKLEATSGIPEIPAIKYLLMRKGIIKNDTCRAPLRALTEKEKKQLDTLL